jgi:hypothetical protein
LAKESRTFTGECFILERIVRDETAITFVAHDDEGDWFFIDDEEWDEKDVILIKGADVLTLDPTLEALTDLPLDWEAERADGEAEWVRQKSE